MFLDFFDKPYNAFDIEPEDERIIKQNYLDLNLDYIKGRCIIGNPPYGRALNLAVQFFKKSIQLGDYISFILPVSQLNNNIKMYEFDLIHSENLGIKLYSNKKVHCCFNIYKRPINNKLNNKISYDLIDIEIREAKINQNPKRNKIVLKSDFDYDVRICAWGNGNKIGKIVDFDGQYVKEFCIKINNIKYRNKIINLIKNVKWREIYPMTNASNLVLWQVYKYIKEQIPEIN